MPFFAFSLPFFGNVWIRKTDREEKGLKRMAAKFMFRIRKKLKKHSFGSLADLFRIRKGAWRTSGSAYDRLYCD